MDPIFDLATDLSQADAILPVSQNSTYTIKAGKVKIGDKFWWEAMSDSEIPMEESKTMNIFFYENSFKNPQVWQHDRMTLEAKIIPFFNNSRYHGRHIQVHKQEQDMK